MWFVVFVWLLNGTPSPADPFTMWGYPSLGLSYWLWVIICEALAMAIRAVLTIARWFRAHDIQVRA